MTSKEYDEILDILISMQREFSTEEDKLREISRDHAVRIDELDEQITTIRKNEDIDFRVFSPRNVSVDNSEKIITLENEKSNLEKEKKEADKQMGYYTGKAEKLEKVLLILKKGLDIDNNIIESTEESNNESSSEDLFYPKKKDPFDFINESDSETEENNINTEDDIDNLFKVDNSDNNKDISIQNDTQEIVNCNGIPIDDIKRVCHKVEFTEKIINNDRIRAKLQLKEIVIELNEMINAYE